jgi:hypothetical protein
MRGVRKECLAAEVYQCCLNTITCCKTPKTQIVDHVGTSGPKIASEWMEKWASTAAIGST